MYRPHIPPPVPFPPPPLPRPRPSQPLMPQTRVPQALHPGIHHAWHPFYHGQPPLPPDQRIVEIVEPLSGEDLEDQSDDKKKVSQGNTAGKEEEPLAPVITSYQAFMLERADPLPGGKQSWGRVGARPLPFADVKIVDLVKKHRRKSGTTPMQDFATLASNQQGVINRLLAEKGVVEAHPNAMWSLVDVQKVYLTRGWMKDLHKIQIVLKRHASDKARSPQEGSSSKRRYQLDEIIDLSTAPPTKTQADQDVDGQEADKKRTETKNTKFVQVVDPVGDAEYFIYNDPYAEAQETIWADQQHGHHQDALDHQQVHRQYAPEHQQRHYQHAPEQQHGNYQYAPEQQQGHYHYAPEQQQDHCQHAPEHQIPQLPQHQLPVMPHEMNHVPPVAPQPPSEHPQPPPRAPGNPFMPFDNLVPPEVLMSSNEWSARHPSRVRASSPEPRRPRKRDSQRQNKIEILEGEVEELRNRVEGLNVKHRPSRLRVDTRTYSAGSPSTLSFSSPTTPTVIELVPRDSPRRDKREGYHLTAYQTREDRLDPVRRDHRPSRSPRRRSGHQRQAGSRHIIVEPFERHGILRRDPQHRHRMRPVTRSGPSVHHGRGLRRRRSDGSIDLLPVEVDDSIYDDLTEYEWDYESTYGPQEETGHRSRRRMYRCASDHYNY